MVEPVVAVEAVESCNDHVGNTHANCAPDGELSAAYSVNDEEGDEDCD